MADGAGGAPGAARIPVLRLSPGDDAPAAACRVPDDAGAAAPARACEESAPRCCAAHEESGPLVCAFCLESTDEGGVRAPCGSCRGTLACVHADCLRHDLQARAARAVWRCVAL
jgi:hypothetical protein